MGEKLKKNPKNGRGDMLAGVGKTGEKMKEARGHQKMPRAVQASGRRCRGLEQADG